MNHHHCQDISFSIITTCTYQFSQRFNNKTNLDQHSQEVAMIHEASQISFRIHAISFPIHVISFPIHAISFPIHAISFHDNNISTFHTNHVVIISFCTTLISWLDEGGGGGVGELVTSSITGGAGEALIEEGGEDVSAPTLNGGWYSSSVVSSNL